MPLQRSRKNKMIAGVCGGLAEWLGWDPTLVRVLYVLVSVFSAAFPGLLVYVILWMVMACVLGGFTLSGGHIGALIHPAEILTIGGAAAGAAIVMSPFKVLKDLMHGLNQALKD